MKRTLAALLILLALAGAAHAFGLGLGNRFGKLGAGGGGSGHSGPTIVLSNNTISSTASIGTTVGTLSVVGGTGSYTFTLTSNPGSLYVISGSNLNVAAALTTGSDPITIKADNGAGGVITQPFTIVVASACSNSMNFSQACNSQYIF